MDWGKLVIETVPVVVTLATVVTAATPTRADNKVLSVMLRILNLLAGNVGRNRNADDCN